MSDIAHNLLIRYYGCNEEFNAEKSVTIHDCSDQIKHNNQCSTEQELINVNRKDSSIKEIEDEESKTYCDKENSAINFQKVYSPAFNVEDLDNDMNLDKYDSFVELCITDEIAQNRRSSKERFTKDLDNGPDDTNEWCSMPVDDVLLDSASDISSVVTKRKPQKLSETSSTTSFIPKSKKTPVYNDVFVDLTDTGLAIFPMDVILQFCQLRMLYLENNNLSEIPSELFTSLRSLEWLDLRNNVIKTLPTTIKSHPSLHTLLLQHNKIEILPLELCLIPNLKTLQITDNPLIVPPKNVVTLGISSILNFLRMEWNRQYPDQIIEPKGNIELTSVIPSYDRSSCKQTRKRTSIVKFNNRNDKEIFKRKKEKHYRPNNRCDSKGTDIIKEQRLLYIFEITKMLDHQASTLQKMKARTIEQQWRDDKRSFRKSMNKAAERKEDDIPFAVDMADYPFILKQKVNSSKGLISLKKSRKEFVPPIDINQEIYKLSKSLSSLRTADSAELTPITKQKLLKDEIDKISDLQDEIQNLQYYNTFTLTPFN